MTKITVEIANPNLVEKFIKFLCSELNIAPDLIGIVPHEIEDGNLGMCLDLSETKFAIFVREENRNIGQVFVTIAHEMIHVKQYMKENLNEFLANCSAIPYLDRWWEKEAFGNAAPLVEKFTKTLKNI